MRQLILHFARFYLNPPEILISCPVTILASSVERNTAMFPKSSGVASRPSGVRSIIRFTYGLPVLASNPRFAKPSVKTILGSKEFTRMFLGPNSCESDVVNKLIAAFVAPYTDNVTSGAFAATV